MKTLLTIMFALLCAPLMAATGIYYNPEAAGEGITVQVNDGHHVVFFFTYGGPDCELVISQDEVTLTATVTATATAECPVDRKGDPIEDCVPVTVEDSSSETETFSYPVYDEVCTSNGQRWFMMSDAYDEDTGWVEGTFYWAQGIDYPFGEISPVNPFEYDVGQAIPVGTYVLQETETGYQLRVFQLEEESLLDDSDPLFNTIYDFSRLLFAPGD
jgi:hypothetical protein